MKRTALVNRKTKETDIQLSLCLDGNGTAQITTGIGFLDHMLTSFTVHSGFDLSVNCSGDLEVDGHHTVEDIGICLGKAFAEALKDKSGIIRYSSAYIPMDESLGFCAVDISGRSFLVFNAEFFNEKIGGYETCLTEEFMRAFAFNAGITLHLSVSYGKNDHHKVEALFKALAYSLKQAVSFNSTGTVVSSKGVI